jgi:integrase
MRYNIPERMDKKMKEKIKAFRYHGRQVSLVRGKRGDRYRASVWHDGRNYILTGRTKDEIKRLIDDCEKGSLARQQKSSDDKMTVKEAWEQFLQARRGKVQENTYRKYVQVYNSHLRYFESYAMDDITADMIDSFVVNELKGLKRWTIETHMRVLFAFLRWCYDNGKMSRLITKGDVTALWQAKTITSQQTTTIHTMTVQEYEKYKKTYLLNRAGGDFALACDLCFYAGLRISEAIGLRGVDVAITDGGYIITVRQKAAITLDDKGRKKQIFSEILKSKNSRRTIPIDDRLATRLTRRAEQNEDKDGTILTRLNICTVTSHHSVINSRIRRDNAKREEKDRIKIITLHELRKSYLTRCALSGMDVYTLQTIAGHDSIETTRKHYINITDNDAAERARRIMITGKKEGKR